MNRWLPACYRAETIEEEVEEKVEEELGEEVEELEE